MMQGLAKEEVEFKIFKWLLIGGIFFWMFRIMRNVVLEVSGYYLTADFLFLMGTVAILYSLRFKNIINELKLIYCIGWVIGFVYYWHSLGGLNGPMTYVFFTVTVVFIGFIPNNFKEVFAVILCGTALLLAWDYDKGSLVSVLPLSSEAKQLLGIDYVLNSVIIVTTGILLKNKFDGERKYIERQNKELIVINGKIQQRNEELRLQSLKIEGMKNNLESIIKERTVELEKRHQLLEKYAYENAHLVRKPLTNIQGLLNVFEIEQSMHNIPVDNIYTLRKNIFQLDNITKKINSTVQ